MGIQQLRSRGYLDQHSYSLSVYLRDSEQCFCAVLSSTIKCPLLVNPILDCRMIFQPVAPGGEPRGHVDVNKLASGLAAYSGLVPVVPISYTQTRMDSSCRTSCPQVARMSCLRLYCRHHFLHRGPCQQLIVLHLSQCRLRRSSCCLWTLRVCVARRLVFKFSSLT